MGEVISIFAGGQLHRQLLDQIERLELTSLNGRLALRFIVATDTTQTTWLLSHVWDLDQLAFQFIVDGGKRTLTGFSRHSYGSVGELNLCMVIEFHQEAELGKWDTLEIVLIAGKEEKSFIASKEGRPEVKQTS
jgi:hypothetical protein